MRRRAGGFTLIELLIAMSMMAVILGVAYGTYAATTASAARCSTTIAREQDGRGLLRIMARELRCAYVRPASEEGAGVRGGTPSRAVGVEGPPQFAGGEGAGAALLRFVTAGGMSGPSGMEVGLSEVAYRLDAGSGTLFRMQRRLAGRRVAAPGWRPIARDLREASVEFFDGAEWRDSWDSNEEKGLPQAARVSLTFGDPDTGRSSFSATIPLALGESHGREVTLPTGTR